MTQLEQITEQEERAGDHSVSEDEEERILAYLAKLEAEGREEEAAALLRKRKICSCGYFTCGAIGLYGHPVPVFQESIEPLFPQSSRDRRALELKS